MTYDWLVLLAVPAMSWLDRQRGTPKAQEVIPKLPALLGIGYLCAGLTGHWLDWQAIVITLSVAISHNAGFGEPIGHALTGRQGELADDGTTYEPWQIGQTLKDNPWAALALRGLFVGFWSLLALDPVASLKIALAFGIAFPLAAAFVRFVLKKGEEGWAIMEYTRGALIGLLLVVLHIVRT